MHREDLLENPRVIYHPEWLKKWREDPFSVLPIYVEISPVGWCNHRCTFCAPEILGYQRRSLSLEVMAKCFGEMERLREDDPGKIGFKGIQLAGEGEPMLHKKFAEICRLIRKAGIDLGILTNGTLMNERLAEEIIPLTSGYLQVSVNAGKAETYAKIHQAPIAHWNLVWENLKKAMRIKNESGISNSDIGVNMTLLVKEALAPDGRIVPANWTEMEELVARSRDAGVDYISIKPYSQDSYSQATRRLYGDMNYKPFLDRIFETAHRLMERYNTAGFEVVFRFSRFLEESETGEKAYPVCLAVPTLWAYIQSDGCLLSCSQWTNSDFILGNIYQNTIGEIWFGETRRCHLDFILNRFDMSVCRVACHPEKENRALTRIKAMSDEEFNRNLKEWRKLPKARKANFI